MAKKGLPKQGARALLNSWSDANAMVIKNSSKKAAKKSAKKK